jgi:hypothetical protein
MITNFTNFFCGNESVSRKSADIRVGNGRRDAINRVSFTPPLWGGAGGGVICYVSKNFEC